MPKRIIAFLTFFLLVTLALSLFPIALSSTGNIRINSKSQSVPDQLVQVGGSIDFYFGDVFWSGQDLILFLSHDLLPQISSGDFVYSPIISVYDLTSATKISNYTDLNGGWLVGGNWINGSIAQNTPVGNYSIKAFDSVTSSVAVTDTYFTVYSVVYTSTLQVSPSSGPGGIPVQFTGTGYPASSAVTISYYDPAFGSWNYLTTTTTDAQGRILVDSQVPDLRRSVGNGDFPEGVNQISYRSEIAGIVYSHANYNQYMRGLKRVGNQTAFGLYGNGTNLASTVKVRTGDAITISGKWFHPGVVYIRWDGQAVVGTVTSDQWRNAVIIGNSIAGSSGFFETTVAIPDADGGEHYIAVEDSETIVIIKVLVSRGSLLITPSSGPGGVSVLFSGSGYPPSSSVTISYSDFTYNNTWRYWTTTTSSPSGTISVSSEMPDLRKSLGTGDYQETTSQISFKSEVNGILYCYAYYNEYSRGLKTVGSQTANGLYGNGTNLASSVRIKSGNSLTISGRWFHPGVVYIRWDGVAVVGTVTGDEWRNAVILGSTIASSSGSFTTAVTVPTANAGEHFIAIEDSETKLITKVYVEQSPTPTPTPTPIQTTNPTPTATPTPSPKPSPTPDPQKAMPTLTVSCRSSSSQSGFKVEINGKLSSNGNGTEGESVFISYSVNGGNSWEDLIMLDTTADGSFKSIWAPSVTGNYLIRAIYHGNPTLNPTTTVVNLAVDYADQKVFWVTSNSTITQFAFNSESKEISFVASGPTGTKGYVDVYIPKSLIQNISSLTAYIDGKQIVFTSQSQADTWTVSFSYNHSEHTIVVKLDSASSTTATSIESWIIYMVPIVVVVPIAAVFIIKRLKGKNSKIKIVLM